MLLANMVSQADTQASLVPRPQFTLKTLLWLMALVAAFMGGIAWERRVAEARRDAIRATIVSGSDFDWAPIPASVATSPRPD
ncbi:MAG TPA: hypothetical protein VFW87_03735 [Pirellulales bacterium]|nr:hypothetical protein [Pirellulales bacterium]